jgi:hypothetical protein
MIGKAAIFLKHRVNKLAKWATTKPKNKIRTGDPMIKTDNYDWNRIAKDNQIQTKFKFKKRREILKTKESFGLMAGRKFKKATPLGKVGYASLAVAPKAAFLGVGYLAAGDKEE